MPRRRGHDSSREIEAASRGAALAQEGEEALLRETDITGAAAQELLQRGAGLVTEEKHRKEDREFQREEAMRDRASRAELQAQETGSRERIVEKELEQRKLEREEDKRRYGEQTDLELAKHGLMRSGENGGAQQPGQQPGAPLPGQMGPPSPEDQRRQEQLNRGMEGVGDGQPRFIPTPEERAAQEAKQGTALATAQYRLLREQRLRAGAVERHKAAALKRDEEAMKAERETLQAPIKADSLLLEKVVNGEIDDATRASLRESLGDHFSPQLQAELEEGGTPGPFIGRAIKTRMATKGVEMAAMTGDLPDPDLMNTEHPIWQQFFQTTAAVNQFFAASDVASWLKISSMPQKNRLVRKAAGIVMMTKAQTRAATAKARSQGVQPQRAGASPQFPQRTAGFGGGFGPK